MSYNFCPTHGLTLPLRNVHSGRDFRPLLEREGTKGIECHDVEEGSRRVIGNLSEKAVSNGLPSTFCIQ